MQITLIKNEKMNVRCFRRFKLYGLNFGVNYHPYKNRQGKILFNDWFVVSNIETGRTVDFSGEDTIKEAISSARKFLISKGRKVVTKKTNQILKEAKADVQKA